MQSIDVINNIIKNNPVLSATQQLNLVKLWQNSADKNALDKLILSNMKIVSKEAVRMKAKNYYISYEDLMQEGIAGLLKAANMFDFSQEVTFLTYAMWWVKANMKRYVMDYRSVVKMGTTRDDRTLFSNLSRVAREAEEAGLVGQEKFDAIASILSVKKESLHQMLCSLKGLDVRLDLPVKSGEDNETLKVDLLKDDACLEQQFFDSIEFSTLLAAIGDIILTLPDVERQVIEQRFLSDPPKTLREIEKDMDISREWVRKIEIRAVDRIKKRLSSQYGIKEYIPNG
jgi:RNA polymerase sigma-32 factor